MDLFIVSATYDSAKMQSWIVGTCITVSGRHITNKDPFPPVSVHDLPPPGQNKIVADIFDNKNIVGEEGDPDGSFKGDPDTPQIDIFEDDNKQKDDT